MRIKEESPRNIVSVRIDMDCADEVAILQKVN